MFEILRSTIGSTSPGLPSGWRRLLHVVAGSAIPCLAIPLTPGVMVGLMSFLAGLALLAEVARLKLPSLNSVLVSWFKSLLKETEERRVTGATYITLSGLATFLLFDESIAIVALLFLSLGDPAAALIGSRVGGVRIYGKSPLGTLAFLLVALAVTWVLTVTGVVSWHWGLAVGALVAGLVELLGIPPDDNVAIPLISGGAMTGLIAL